MINQVVAEIMNYNKEEFTYGYELELGDIERNTVIPEHLGSWEHCETDIVNLNGRYRGMACDPAGINPPVGGEINTKPTRGWIEQVDRVMDVISLFENPTASVVNHGHLHISVPGLKDDVDALKRLTQYIKDNQHLAIDTCYLFEDLPEMEGDKAKTYLKWDGGRKMPDWMCDNIINMAEDFDDYIRIHCCGKDGVSRGRPFRYGINTYCMKHTGTIEFRCFRASINEKHINDQFKFVEEFIDAALNNPTRTVEDILSEYQYEFPPFIYDREMSLAWKDTKRESDPKLKVRKRYEVS